MASSNVDDDIFAALYPWMSWDIHAGDLPGTYGTREHRLWVWEQARDLKKSGPGMLVQLNRWFQLWQKLRPFLATCRKVVHCIEKGCYQQVSDLSLFVDEAATDTHKRRCRQPQAPQRWPPPPELSRAAAGETWMRFAGGVGSWSTCVQKSWPREALGVSCSSSMRLCSRLRSTTTRRSN